MGEFITLTADDGHSLAAYKAEPATDTSKGAVVVIQEIFGVNENIRGVTDRFAEAGYTAIAPAIFDRWKRNVDLGYDDGAKTVGIALRNKSLEYLGDTVSDVKAALDAVADAGKVGITGYCWGGVVTWAAACRLSFDAAVCYYGRGIVDLLDETPTCPTILHFGENDASIPMAEVETIRTAHPDCPVYIYDAGHGFSCNHRADFNAEASQAALVRTMDLFRQNLG